MSIRQHALRIGKTDLLIQDHPLSAAVWIITDELEKDAYGLRRIAFAPGDVVIDVGGHVGMFSIYLAKRFPFLEILACEPVPENAANFRANLTHNDVHNVRLLEVAITADGRDFPMLMHASNTGGATSQAHTRLLPQLVPDFRYFTCPSLSLDTLCEREGLGRIKLLKLDCEGLEYEILNRTNVLPRVEYLCGELHANRQLEAQGCSTEQLKAHCARFVDPAKTCFTFCQISN